MITNYKPISSRLLQEVAQEALNKITAKISNKEYPVDLFQVSYLMSQYLLSYNISLFDVIANVINLELEFHSLVQYLLCDFQHFTRV